MVRIIFPQHPGQVWAGTIGGIVPFGPTNSDTTSDQRLVGAAFFFELFDGRDVWVFPDRWILSGKIQVDFGLVAVDTSLHDGSGPLAGPAGGLSGHLVTHVVGSAPFQGVGWGDHKNLGSYLGQEAPGFALYDGVYQVNKSIGFVTEGLRTWFVVKEQLHPVKNDSDPTDDQEYGVLKLESRRLLFRRTTVADWETEQPDILLKRQHRRESP